MTWTATELIEVILKNLTDRIALAALFIALILIGFAKLAPDMTLGQWITAHIIVFYLIALGAVCFLPTRHILEGVDGRIASRRKRRNLIEQMESLGSEATRVLYNPIKARQISFEVYKNDFYIAKGLEQRGIVSEVDYKGSNADAAFVIEKEAFNYLVQHPELVGIKKDS